MLGVLRAGAAFLPVDPAYPAERIAWMLDDAGVELVVASGDGAADLPVGGRTIVAIGASGAPEAERPAEPAVGGQEAAYVIYTSGSTGRPKGVVVEHRNLAAYVEVAAAEQQAAPGTRVLQLASISFDTSAEEIWPCLTRGGTLVLRDEAAAGSGRGFCDFVAAHRVEVADLPTAFWHELAAEVAAGDARLPESLRLVIIGGERALGERLADWWRAPGADAIRLLNTYGPTETTIVAVSTPLAPATAVSRPTRRSDAPIPGARAVLLDASGRPVPPGAPGELAIGGAGVARGYLGRPGPDRRAFRARSVRRRARSAPLPDRRSLRPERPRRRGRRGPGLPRPDRRPGQGARLPDRAGGDRVGPRRPPGGGGGGGRRPAARLGGRPPPGRLPGAPAGAVGGEPPGRRTRSGGFVAERLPEFMVPALYVPVAALPKTASGKVDRRALPEPEALHAGGGAVYVAPRTPTEELLAGLWCELLGLDRVGVRDDFFALGGHSLLVGRLAARLRSTLGVELPLLEIFEHPTVAELAIEVEPAEAGERSAARPAAGAAAAGAGRPERSAAALLPAGAGLVPPAARPRLAGLQLPDAGLLPGRSRRRRARALADRDRPPPRDLPHPLPGAGRPRRSRSSTSRGRSSCR